MRPTTAGGPSARDAKGSKVPRDPRIPKGADPTRSIYYDPVFNPYGAPPPGLPYKEREPSPDAYHVAKKPRPAPPKEEDSDDDIVMPAGPPPLRRTARPAAPRTKRDRTAAVSTVAAPVTYTQPSTYDPATEPVFDPDEQAPAATDPEPEPEMEEAQPTVLSAAPEMRDFKKETTAFVPASVRQRQRREARAP
ncbi:hypothetical protein MCAP1_001067 [Malassezia caprae]|uniref:Uncharacterized protein n=1 Tax=Malassezia caprae TaxID=1381934 RepID=A0AAF0E584_9BASI|nr:hypothetical protein MCAP1_001067 [Malassezia caprae]